MNSFWLACQLLSRIPTPQQLCYQPAEWGKAALWLPMIGLILSGILWLVSYAPFTPFSLATLILISWIAFTGALHLDGFADSVDAWIGGIGNQEKTLSIMKDPHIGSMSVVALFSLLLLKAGLIYELIAQQAAWTWLLIPIAARSQTLLLLLTTPYAKPTGMGSDMQKHLPKKLAWGIFWFTNITLSIIDIKLALAIAISLLGWWYFRRAWLARISGITGDLLGAWIEISELLLLLTAALL